MKGMWCRERKGGKKKKNGQVEDSYAWEGGDIHEGMEDTGMKSGRNGVMKESTAGGGCDVIG